MFNFEGKTAVVTGGVGGIGQAVSATFKKAGAQVIATGYDQREIDEKKNDAPLEDIRLEPVNVADNEAVGAFAKKTGPIDILVNCAGVGRIGTDILDENLFKLVVEVNLHGTMRMCREFFPTLKQRGGVIVNTASMMSFFGTATNPSYAASKGGVAQLTKSLAIAWAPEGVRVNAVAPGWIRTPMTEAIIKEELGARVAARTPMGRWGEPQYIADAVAFLCSPQAAFITGVILPVDGGYSVA